LELTVMLRSTIVLSVVAAIVPGRMGECTSRALVRSTAAVVLRVVMGVMVVVTRHVDGVVCGRVCRTLL